MKILKEHSVFVFVFVSCFILRFVPLFEYQFTYDELSGLERTRFDNFGDLIRKGVMIDAHPALIQVVIFILVKLFGYTTWIIKLPFLVAGMASVYYGYLFGLKNFSKHAGNLMAIFLGYSLVFVFYAPVARMYGPGVFFSLALLHHFFAIFYRNDHRRKHFFLLGLFGLLSALNHHINALFAFTVFSSGLLFLTRATARPYLLTCALVIAAYLPGIPVTLYQLGLAGIGREQGGWLEKPGWDSLPDFIRILLGTGKTYLAIGAVIIAIFFTGSSVAFGRRQIFLITMFVVNFLIVYFYSVYRAPVFQHSVMLFAGVCLLPVIASLMVPVNMKAQYAIHVVMAGMLLWKTYIGKDYFRQCVTTVYEYQFERTFYYKAQFGGKEVYPVFFDADISMKKIYFGNYGKEFECAAADDSVLNDLRSYSELVAGLDCDYLVLTSAFPEQQAVARQYFPFLLENTQTQANNYRLYSRRRSDSSLVVPDDPVLRRSIPGSGNTFTYETMNGSAVKPVHIDAGNEFPLAAKAKYGDVIGSEGQVILVSAELKRDSAGEGDIQVCVSINSDTGNINYGYSAKSIHDFPQSGDRTTTIYSGHFIGTKHKSTGPNSTVTCYLWNRGRSEFSLRNFEIGVIDFWKAKWHFWD